MRFWDSSAVVPLLVAEPVSGAREAMLQNDPVMLVWWSTPVECASAVQRLIREGSLRETDSPAVAARLRQLERMWIEVEPTQDVREQAQRLLRVHPLRAADALQLAAAVLVCRHHPSTLAFVTADERLATAARREGFEVEA